MRPDPPVSVNWTLLDISSSGLNYDVLVNWNPPPSADTKFGWMSIMYELQHRDRNATNWEIVSLSLIFFTLYFPKTVLHALTLYTHIAFTTTAFPLRGKKCFLVRWARCHVSFSALWLEAKCIRLCWQGGGSQSVALWENTAPLEEVMGREGSVGQRPRDLKQARICCSLDDRFRDPSTGKTHSPLVFVKCLKGPMTCTMHFLQRYTSMA